MACANVWRLGSRQVGKPKWIDVELNADGVYTSETSSSADMRGMRTCTSARSTDWCCAMRPSTVSDTPTRINVALPAR